MPTESPFLPHLFQGLRGGDGLGRVGVYRIVRRRFEEAGVAGTIGPHDIRHTSASHAAPNLSESEMMSLYGWRDADMVRHYTAQVRQQLAIDAHARNSPLEAAMKAQPKRGRRK